MKLKIGENIAKHRKLRGYTQEQLGELVGVSGQAVSKWENGGVPDTYLLPTISKVLGVSIDALFGVEKKISDYSQEEILDLLCQLLFEHTTLYFVPRILCRMFPEAFQRSAELHQSYRSRA